LSQYTYIPLNKLNTIVLIKLINISNVKLVLNKLTIQVT